MHFRSAERADLDAIMGVLADGRAHLAALGVDQWQRGYPQRRLIERDIAQGCSYVVERDGRVAACAMVGFCGEPLYDRIDEGAWLTDSTSVDARYAVVHRVCVAADCRGRGVAGFLMSSIEELARERGFESVRIETHPGNAPMRRLLERCGYAACGYTLIEHAEGGTPRRIAYEKLL